VILLDQARQQHDRTRPSGPRWPVVRPTHFARLSQRRRGGNFVANPVEDISPFFDCAPDGGEYLSPSCVDNGAGVVDEEINREYPRSVARLAEQGSWC